MIFSIRNMMKKASIEQLERQGCYCADWSRVRISENADLAGIRNVYFRGDVEIGDNPVIINVHGGIENIRIGNNVRIVNVARIERSPEARFGIGHDIDVLDETGHRIVRIFPGISSQIATLMARMPEAAREKLLPLADMHIRSLPDMPEIGDGAEILDSGILADVRVWPHVRIEGAARLVNGSIVNNSSSSVPLAYVGQGVDAENFIFEDAEVAGGCIIRNSYAGQGTILDKGFSAHDSLFFANCSMENGEACALLAGPYSVSMHKSSLLIGVQTSFFNAGSASNMSNHMYKLGPVNWGVLERGVKFSSNAYVMQGARIGAFSLVMGDHKTHPDTSSFPFSYLFGDHEGRTSVLPAAMLRSCGLRRDSEKWPARDRRQEGALPLIDNITFAVFNPYTIGRIISAIALLNKIAGSDAGMNSASDDIVTYHKLKFRRKSLKTALRLYSMAVYAYLHTKLGNSTDISDSTESAASWLDLGGQIMPLSYLEKALAATSIAGMQSIFNEAARKYSSLETAWIRTALRDWVDSEGLYARKAAELAALIDADREAALDALAAESAFLSLNP